MKINSRLCFKRISLTALYLLLVLSLGACSKSAGSSDEDASQDAAGQASDDTQSSASFDAMDTYMTITVYGTEADAAAEAAREEIERLDGILSAEDEGSEVYEVNAAKGGTLSEDCAYLLEASLKLWQATGGAFDITVYPVAQLWGFTTGNYAVPSDEELAQALSCVDSDLLVWDPETSVITMQDGMAIGFGGIAKGYTGDKITEIFSQYDITGAIASLGGNIVVYGTKPGGESWKVAIQDPEDTSAYACVLSIDYDANIITSGGYERYFEEDGVTYHHIIDPETGYPASSGLASVSIITTCGTEGDGLSTALFVMGLEDAIEFWRTADDYDFEMVLVDDDGVVYISEGLADSYSSSNEVVIISRDD